jgi:glycosyltransferase involved in cell wall biosynthesis
MIVKDESPVIRRCLESVKPHIDHWVIVDTGSTDGTQDLVRELLADIPGTLYERPWKNFGHNRTEALELARGTADYTFIIDADDEFVAPDGMPELDPQVDAYDIVLEGTGISFPRTLVVSNRHAWRFVGVLHEYITTDGTTRRDALKGVRIIERREGARTRSVSTREKYFKDALVLEEALRDEPDNSRYVFYLAQSYRDAGLPDAAFRRYEVRTRMGGWDEEVYFSLLEMARLTRLIGTEPSDVVYRHLTAYQSRPTRIEPLVELAQYHRAREEWALALLVAERAIGIPLPADRLFVSVSYWKWGALDEYAIAAYWCGQYRECEWACRKLLDGGDLPDAERDRVQRNLDWALQRLQEA